MAYDVVMFISSLVQTFDEFLSDEVTNKDRIYDGQTKFQMNELSTWVEEEEYLNNIKRKTRNNNNNNNKNQ